MEDGAVTDSTEASHRACRADVVCVSSRSDLEDDATVGES